MPQASIGLTLTPTGRSQRAPDIQRVDIPPARLSHDM